MEFISLYKKFVQSNNEDFNSFYLSRFSSESAIHLPLKINEYDAFVFIHPSVLNKVAKIYSLDKEVSESFIQLPTVALEQYVKKSLIDEIEYTNAIEGVVSTRQEIGELLEGINKRRTVESRFEGIVNKYVLLLRRKEIQINNVFDIRKIYDDMLYQEIESENKDNVPDGKLFRKSNVWVYDERNEKIHAGIMPEEKIILYLEEALRFLKNEEIDFLIRVSVFHFLFGYIHPFYDGNGRVDRFISSYLLSKQLTSIVGFRLSMTIKENIRNYYSAFKETDDKRNRGDITTFVMAFLDILIDALEKTKKYATNKNQDLKYYTEIVDKQEYSSKTSLKVIKLLLQVELFSKSGLLISDISRISNNTPKTVAKAINELKEKSMIKTIMYGKRKQYTADLDSIGQLDEKY